MSYEGTLVDDADSLGLGCIEVEYEINYVIDPGDPGCYRTPNGDGWPSSPACVEMTKLTITGVYPPEGKSLPFPLTASWMERIKEWADRRLEIEWDEIEKAIFERDEEKAHGDY